MRSLDDSGGRATTVRRVLDAGLVAFFLALIVAVVALSFLKPMTADDYANIAVLKQHPGPVSFVAYWYGTWTGRVTGMLLLWGALRSKLAFSVLNGLVFAALPWLVLAVGSGRRPRASGRDLALATLLLVAFWYALPAAGQTAFWLTGSVTYLWGAVLMLLFVLPFRLWYARPSEREPWTAGRAASAFGMLLLGVATGAMHEQSSAGLLLLAGALVWVMVRDRTLRLPPRLIAGLAGLAAGVVVLFASPGNAGRSDLTPVSANAVQSALDLARYLTHVMFTWLPPLYPWLAIVAVVAIGAAAGDAGAHEDVRRGVPWWIWALSGAVTVGVFVAQPTIANLAGERTAIFLATLLATAAASPLQHRDPSDETGGRPVRPLIVGLAVLVLAATAYDARVNLTSARALAGELARRKAQVEEARLSGERDVSVPPLATTPARLVFYGDVTPDPEHWINKAMAAYYGVRTITLEDDPRE